LALPGESAGQSVVGVEVIRLEVDGLAVFGLRLGRFAESLQDQAEVGAVNRVGRPEAGGLAEAGQGTLVVVPVVEEEHAQVGVGVGVIRLEADRLPQGGLRLGELALPPEAGGVADTSLGEFRLEVVGLLVEWAGLSRLALPA